MRCLSLYQPVAKVWRIRRAMHPASGVAPLQILPVFSVVAPFAGGRLAVSVRRQTFTTSC